MITSIDPQFFGGHTLQSFPRPAKIHERTSSCPWRRDQGAHWFFKKIDFRTYSFCGHGQFFQQPQLYSQEIVGYFATFTRNFMHTPTKGRKEMWIWNVADVYKVSYEFCNLIHPKQGSNCQQKIWWPKADYLRGILDLIELKPCHCSKTSADQVPSFLDGVQVSIMRILPFLYQ